MAISTSTVTLDVADKTQMNAYVAEPGGKGKHPGILVFQEAFGVNDYIKSVAERFAKLGFVAIAPELFHRTEPGFQGSYTDYAGVQPHMQALTNEGLLADAAAAHAWLADNERVEAGKIASVGFCMGGRVSYLANSALDLAAAVSFYGGGIAPGLLDRAPQLHGPMLFFWGGKDTHIPADQRQSILDAMQKAEKLYVNVEYSEAGHGFFCDARASYHPESSAQAWAAVQAFLKTHGLLA